MGAIQNDELHPANSFNLRLILTYVLSINNDAAGLTAANPTEIFQTHPVHGLRLTHKQT